MESPESVVTAADVQALIDALPDASTITSENAESVSSQLVAIDDAMDALEEVDAESADSLDLSKYDAVVAAIDALSSNENGDTEEEPETVSEDTEVEKTVDPLTVATTDWDTSKSKTATELKKQDDGTYTSDVTLSLPSAEEELVSDVVFVLDKSTSANLKTQVLSMLYDLKTKVESTNATVNVGVVIFNKVAYVANDGNFFDLSTQYNEIKTEIEKTIKSGTNCHAGLLAGKKMLDDDKDVDASRKYLIFVSDGITYLFDNNGTPSTVYTKSYACNASNGDGWVYGNMDAGILKSCYKTDISDMGTHLAKVKELVEADGEKYWYEYHDGILSAEDAAKVSNTLAYNVPAAKTTNEIWNSVKNDAVDLHANNVDTALYLTYQTYQAAIGSGYNCYAMTANAEASSTYPWATSFMGFLANGEEVSFDSIAKDVYYLLDAGSTVVDVIGAGTDSTGDAYDFDFVDSADALKLTVNGTALSVTKLENDSADVYVTSTYGFGEATDGKYPYVLKYYANGQNGQSDEYFVWEINTAVSKFAPVQLTYTVKLTTPGTTSGDHTKLQTNKEATLTPVDSNGNKKTRETFPKPEVSYTVTPTSSTPSSSGGSQTTIEEEDTPLADAPDDSTVIEEEETPLTDIEDEDTALADVPETGDAVYVWCLVAIVACMGAAGVAIKRKGADR